jgi:hypothetical protein
MVRSTMFVASAACLGVCAAFARAQPDNDACANALPLTDGVIVALNTTFADPTQPDIFGLCGESEFASDVWFRYVPAQTTSVTISLCGSSFDTVLSVHPTCAEGVNSPIACNDDAPGCAPLTTSRLSLMMSAGTPYYIRVAGYLGDFGPARILVTGGGGGMVAAPENDSCFNAAGVNSGSTIFTTLHATTDGPAHSAPVPGGCSAFGSDQITGDVWFRYVSSISGVLDVSTCGSNFDTRLAVYAGEQCGSLTAPGVLLACNDDAQCPEGNQGGGSPA